MGVREPFLHKLVGIVAQMMKQPYPELAETADRVAKVIQAEEENFLGTIDAGLDRIRRMFQQMAAENRAMVSGEEAAEMFQTHGFPPELFEAMAAERNLLFDWDGFRREMEQHGDESGAARRWSCSPARPWTPSAPSTRPPASSAMTRWSKPTRR